MKTKTICFLNNKGGCGKTTTCCNVGYALAEQGYKVLLIDADMQMNLTLSYFPEETVLALAMGDKNIYDVIKNKGTIQEKISSTAYPNVDLIASSSLMSGIEYELLTRWQREYILKNAMQELVKSEHYDYILIDSPPTLGGWVMNILCAADYLLIPVEASPWGLFGIANLFEFLEASKQIAPQLQVLGVVVTKADERKAYLKQTLEALKDLESTYVFKNYIHVDSAIEWAQEASKPVLVHKKNSRSAAEYLALAKEMAIRCQ
ncbi:chromosome partitioning protein ParA [Sporanaerobium hydrogeniformans]|uniref:Chromosome partitioning protein ParA n=1 Tax=Sporanaerobium hydrogeniformans TaxID=3072179 RepID=A0AC61D9Z7_9FIRM|nr:AAA family ATPase [Sporanaerobium hydrogeniformans]PHV69578.1 chromosome partitioning protein ParA [Sporanaerobium hydrogeniformans]